MGYGTRPGDLGHTIRTFTPDNTEDYFWIDSSLAFTLEDILAMAGEKWPEDIQYNLASLARLEITSENIQTDCLDYDRHDELDYRDFLKITLLKK